MTYLLQTIALEVGFQAEFSTLDAIDFRGTYRRAFANGQLALLRSLIAAKRDAKALWGNRIP